MSAREAVIAEMKNAPESLVQETYEFVLFLKSKAQRIHGQTEPPSAKPDFLARQKAVFGDRLLPDSQPILNDLRGDRF